MDDTDKEEVTRTQLRIPDISRELIRWMRAVNPQRVIGPDETLASAHRKAGVQDLIDTLDFLSLQQQAFEQGQLTDEEANVLVWEADTVEEGYVLRATR